MCFLSIRFRLGPMRSCCPCLCLYVLAQLHPHRQLHILVHVCSLDIKFNIHDGYAAIVDCVDGSQKSFTDSPLRVTTVRTYVYTAETSEHWKNRYKICCCRCRCSHAQFVRSISHCFLSGRVEHLFCACEPTYRQWLRSVVVSKLLCKSNQHNANHLRFSQIWKIKTIINTQCFSTVLFYLSTGPSRQCLTKTICLDSSDC